MGLAEYFDFYLRMYHTAIVMPDADKRILKRNEDKESISGIYRRITNDLEL